MKTTIPFACCVIFFLAVGHTLAQSDDHSAESPPPGHLVESASTNTSMSIPNWDLDAHKSSPPPVFDPDAEIVAAPEVKTEPANRPQPKSQNQDVTQSVEPPAESAVTVIPRTLNDQARSTGKRVVPRAIDTNVAWYRHPLIALIVVFIAIAAIAWIFRKYVPSARMIPMKAVRVVGRAPISAKHSIALLHIGRRLLVVGMTADRVSTLSEITDPEEVSLLLGDTGETVAEGVFGRQLAEQLDGFGEDSEPTDKEDRSLLNETKGQLQTLMKKLRSVRAA